MSGLASLPTEFLVATLTIALGALYKLVLDRAKKQEDKLEKIIEALVEQDKRFAATATLEQLGRMGDRFDARITSVERESAITKDRLERDK